MLLIASAGIPRLSHRSQSSVLVARLQPSPLPQPRITLADHRRECRLFVVPAPGVLWALQLCVVRKWCCLRYPSSGRVGVRLRLLQLPCELLVRVRLEFSLLLGRPVL